MWKTLLLVTFYLFNLELPRLLTPMSITLFHGTDFQINVATMVVVASALLLAVITRRARWVDRSSRTQICLNVRCVQG